MSDYARGRLDLDDEDRLPWLEPAIDDEADDRISPLRLLGLILLGLALIGAVVAGVWWMQNRNGGGSAGEGQLIAAPTEDYKIAANEADAKKFDGEGDASFAASEGVLPAGKVDPSRMPEEPAVTPAEREAAAKAAKKAAADKAAAAKAAAAKDKPGNAAAVTRPDEPAPKAEPAASGGWVQLGAFSSEAAANKAWGTLSKRFAYLTDLNRSVSPAKVGDGTVYRLRVGAGSAAGAQTLCGKLRVAGENCVVVR